MYLLKWSSVLFLGTSGKGVLEFSFDKSKSKDKVEDASTLQDNSASSLIAQGFMDGITAALAGMSAGQNAAKMPNQINRMDQGYNQNPQATNRFANNLSNGNVMMPMNSYGNGNGNGPQTHNLISGNTNMGFQNGPGQGPGPGYNYNMQQNPQFQMNYGLGQQNYNDAFQYRANTMQGPPSYPYSNELLMMSGSYPVQTGFMMGQGYGYQPVPAMPAMPVMPVMEAAQAPVMLTSALAPVYLRSPENFRRTEQVAEPRHSHSGPRDLVKDIVKSIQFSWKPVTSGIISGMEVAAKNKKAAKVKTVVMAEEVERPTGDVSVQNIEDSVVVPVDIGPQSTTIVGGKDKRSGHTKIVNNVKIYEVAPPRDKTKIVSVPVTYVKKRGTCNIGC